MVEAGWQLKSTGVRPSEKTQTSSTCIISRFPKKVNKGWTGRQQEMDLTVFRTSKLVEWKARR